jgi:serine/threonine protein kinase
MAIGGQAAPARLGRYELLARLATGGMGEIFLARLEGAAGFEKLYVVKRILPHLADDARFRGMLIAEARIASKLSHANICQVYELGETDGQLYIVMEYLEGVTMLPLLRKASKEQAFLDYGFVGGVIQQTSDALHYAHELRDRGGEGLGIVHRDVTPSNIFLTEAGVAKVLDFGIAKVKDASAHTQTGTVKGKYAYMAPEQLRGIAIDRRADVFALGIVTYEMLALRRLFQRKTDYLTFRAVMEQPIPDVRRYRPDVPDALAECLAKALDRDPNSRFETARQFGSAMIDALAALKRPWTQGEVSDYVRENFASDIGKRSEAVAAAILRTKPSESGRSTMPVIAHSSETDTQIDESELDDEFPAVESTVSELPREVRAMVRENTPTDFQGTTPPPFGADSSTSGYQLKPLEQKRIEAASTKRSVLWPVLAITMVGIAGAALFLVWRQMQMQQQPAVVNITSEPAAPSVTPPTPEVGSGSSEPVAVGSGSAKPSPPPAVIRKPDPPPKQGSYNTAIQANKGRIAQCAKDHGVPPSNAKVVIVVTPGGKAKTISLEPADLNASPLGACIKNVLAGAKYPTAAAEMQVSVPIKTS